VCESVIRAAAAWAASVSGPGGGTMIASR
jgi:hypothetical protein